MSNSAVWSKGINIWQWGLIASLFVAIMATAMLVTSQAHEVRLMTRQLGQLRLEQDLARAEWGRLLLEQSTLTSYSKIERQATQHLAMRIPEPQEIRMLSR